jgi:hypothetical protein
MKTRMRVATAILALAVAASATVTGSATTHASSNIPTKVVGLGKVAISSPRLTSYVYTNNLYTSTTGVIITDVRFCTTATAGVKSTGKLGMYLHDASDKHRVVLQYEKSGVHCLPTSTWLLTWSGLKPSHKYYLEFRTSVEASIDGFVLRG